MPPDVKELTNAIIEESEAMKQLAEANQNSTKADLKIKAARKRLSLARAQKSALMNDLMMYSK